MSMTFLIGQIDLVSYRVRMKSDTGAPWGPLMRKLKTFSASVLGEQLEMSEAPSWTFGAWSPCRRRAGASHHDWHGGHSRKFSPESPTLNCRPLARKVCFVVPSDSWHSLTLLSATPWPPRSRGCRWIPAWLAAVMCLKLIRACRPPLNILSAWKKKKGRECI